MVHIAMFQNRQVGKVEQSAGPKSSKMALSRNDKTVAPITHRLQRGGHSVALPSSRGKSVLYKPLRQRKLRLQKPELG